MSRTRVRNQRRITSPVTGFCDGPAMGHLLGYARVSTTDQHPRLQVDALERAGCYRVFTETASGARADRPTLEQVPDQLWPGDTLVVWKLWSAWRSALDVIGVGKMSSGASLWPRQRRHATTVDVEAEVVDTRVRCG